MPETKVFDWSSAPNAGRFLHLVDRAQLDQAQASLRDGLDQLGASAHDERLMLGAFLGVLLATETLRAAYVEGNIGRQEAERLGASLDLIAGSLRELAKR